MYVTFLSVTSCR